MKHEFYMLSPLWSAVKLIMKYAGTFVLFSEAAVIVGLLAPLCSASFPLSIALLVAIAAIFPAIWWMCLYPCKHICNSHELPGIILLNIAAIFIMWYAPRSLYFFPWSFFRIWRFVLIIEAFTGALTGCIIYLARTSRLKRKSWAYATIGCIVAIPNLAMASWLLLPIPKSHSRGYHAITQGQVAKQEVPSSTIIMAYGPEYGSTSIDGTVLGIKSNSFDMAMRKIDFGFSPSEIPLRGELYIPTNPGDNPASVSGELRKAPVVAIVHGSHYIPGEQYTGYRYIADQLAKSGYATLLVDENFLNDRWSGSLKAGEMEARAWTLLCNLNFIRQCNDDNRSQIFNRLDFSKVTLIGHSRGGRAVTLAYAYNTNPPHKLKTHFGFGITGLIEIAPYDVFKQADYDESPIIDADYMLIIAGQDTDVYFASGMETFYKSIKPDDNHWKTAIYIWGATHSGFNTNCHSDRLFPFNLLEETGNRMSPSAQQALTVELITDFLNASTGKESVALSKLSNISLTKPDKYGSDIISTWWQPGKSILVEDFEKDNNMFGAGRVPIYQRNPDCTPVGNHMYRLDRDSIITFPLSSNQSVGESLHGIAFDASRLPTAAGANLRENDTCKYGLNLIVYYPDKSTQGARADTLDVAEYCSIPMPHIIKHEKGSRQLTLHSSRDYEIIPQTVYIPLREVGMPDSVTFTTSFPTLLDNIRLY